MKLSLWYKVAVCATFVIYLLDIVFNALSSISGPILNAIYNGSTQGQISDSFQSILTPAGWAFSIWGVIYFVQMVWLLFSGYLIFIRQIYLVPLQAYLSFSIACVLNAIWLLMYGTRKIIPAFVVLLLLLLALEFTVIYSLYFLHKSETQQISKWIIIVYYIFYLNGLCIYDTWVLLASVLNLDNVLIVSEVDTVTSGTIGAAIILFLFTLYSSLEFSLWRKYMRDIYTIPLVIIYADIGILTKIGSNFCNTNGAFLTFIIACAIFAIINLISKIYLGIKWHFYPKKTRAVGPNVDMRALVNNNSTIQT